VTFIDAFMTEEFFDERLQLYVYGWDSRAGKARHRQQGLAKVKERLLVLAHQPGPSPSSTS